MLSVASVFVENLCDGEAGFASGRTVWVVQWFGMLSVLAEAASFPRLDALPVVEPRREFILNGAV